MQMGYRMDFVGWLGQRSVWQPALVSLGRVKPHGLETAGLAAIGLSVGLARRTSLVDCI